MFNQGLPHLLGGVAAPALVVWGKEDKLVPLNCGQRYVAALANAELKVLEECGHFVEMEKPHELATLVSDFIISGQPKGRKSSELKADH